MSRTARPLADPPRHRNPLSEAVPDNEPTADGPPGLGTPARSPCSPCSPCSRCSRCFLSSLIRSHGDRTLSLLQRLLGNHEDARDAYQETWTAIWRALPRLRPAVDPWPFIRTAAVRKAIDGMRARRRTVVRDGLDGDAWPAPDADPPRDPVDLSGLRREERACLTLFFREGCSVREVAETLEVPVGTVKTWMFRARARLRAQLADGDER